MKNFTATSFFRIIILGLIFALPIVFYRGLLDSFDLTKATFLWIVAPILMFPLLSNLKNVWNDRALCLSTGLVLVAITVSTVLSIRPGSSIFGQYQRYTGVLTWFCGILVMVCTAVLSDRKFVRSSIDVLSAGAFFCASYVFLQAWNLDPWDWVFGGQNKPLFGTMGNINTSAGFLGISICFLIPHFLQLSSLRARFSYGLPILVSASAIGLNESFQGNVAALVGVGVGLLLLASSPNLDFLFPAVILVIVAGSTFVVRSAAIGVVFVLLGIAAIYLWSAVGRLGKLPNFATTSLNRTTRLSLICLGAFVAALSASSLVISEIQDGMRERSAFYQSALKLFVERPIFGFGLETFGYIFSRHRPAWHAISYEANRPSSAHSVFLGLFVSGGIFLAGTVLFLLALAFARSARKLRNGSSFDFVRVSAFSLLLGAVAQSAVSVENIALLVLFLFAVGLNLGSWNYRPARTQVKSPASYFPFVVAACLVPVFWFQAIKPMRADDLARQALVAVNVDNSPDVAVSKFEASIKTAKWDPQQKVRYLSYMQGIGQVDQILDLAVEATEQYMCLPSVALGTMYALAESGDFSRAIEVGECALDADPNSLVVSQQVQMVYEAMAEAALERDQVGIAKAFAAMILEIDPSSSFAISISALEE